MYKSCSDNNVKDSSVPVFMEQQNQQPDITEDHSTSFSHGKGPGYSRHTVNKKREGEIRAEVITLYVVPQKSESTSILKTLIISDICQ